MARSGRFELPTPRFVVWCSIQLSYERALHRLMLAVGLREPNEIGSPFQGPVNGRDNSSHDKGLWLFTTSVSG